MYMRKQRTKMRAVFHIILHYISHIAVSMKYRCIIIIMKHHTHKNCKSLLPTTYVVGLPSKTVGQRQLNIGPASRDCWVMGAYVHAAYSGHDWLITTSDLNKRKEFQAGQQSPEATSHEWSLPPTGHWLGDWVFVWFDQTVWSETKSLSYQ